MALLQQTGSLDNELLSPKVAPLISYLLRSHVASVRDDVSGEGLFEKIKQEVATGAVINPIDEGYQGYQPWMNLIVNGTSKPVTNTSVCKKTLEHLSMKRSAHLPSNTLLTIIRLQ